MNASLLKLCIAIGCSATGSLTAMVEAGNARQFRSADDDPGIVESDAFKRGHPDMRWRKDGLDAFAAGDMRNAYARFRRAARFADKPSQAMVAEMLWQGTGVEKNRPLAYAWMDLAAERQDRDFLLKREFYWQALDSTERARALAVGKAVYAEFGDTVAKPRHAQALKRITRDVTGSRVGWMGYMKTQPFRNGMALFPMDATVFFDDRYWQPEEYWTWQERTWRSYRRGVIDVMPLEQPDKPVR